ncbi:MAG: hydroxyisourate hydrolase [Woeseiaceae bacterium]|nr:hydroxyisourate hydrolase [Woeseiaceae bacterium]
MARLTTHILDTARGRPAADVAVRVFVIGRERVELASARTNRDGRTDGALLQDFDTGTYELEFDVGPYFDPETPAASEPPFLDTVIIRVNLTAGEHYHVPLLASPWSYSTYRGS